MTTSDPAHAPPFDPAVLREDTTPIGYKEFGAMIDRDAQSMRVALKRRRERIAKHGRARPTDIPEPDGYRTTRERRLGVPVKVGQQAQTPGKSEPFWLRCTAYEWAAQTGKFEADGITPKYYRADDAHSKRHEMAA